MLYKTAVTNQWTTKWPYIANVFFSELYKIKVNKVTFLGFTGDDRPNRSPWVRPGLAQASRASQCV